MWCFDCKKDVSGKRKDKCKEEEHDLDYEKLHDGKKAKQQEKDERSASKKCYDFAMTKIKKLVISENNSDDVYAIVEVNSHVEAISLSSARARHWIGDEYSRNIESNEIHADDFFKTVLNHIIAKAHMNGTERAQIHYRIAQAGDSLFYDLGTPDWQFIKVSAKGVEQVKFDVNLPIFRRSQSIQKHVVPNRDNYKALDHLAELLRIVPRDRLVFKVHIVALFLEAYPIPIMVFDGMAGSLKTTATASIKRIVDPSGVEKEDNVSAMAEKQDDLILQLQNRYLSSFDNVSSITQATSDVLSRAITGSSNPRRKLYTDDDESIHSFRRKIVLNGIVPKMHGTVPIYKIQYGCVVKSVLQSWEIKGSKLEQKNNFRGKWTIIDEFNRADIDKAFGQLFTSLETKELLIPTDDSIELKTLPIPKDYRIIGTLNTSDKHYLFKLSDALKRRFAYIEVKSPSKELWIKEIQHALDGALKQLEPETFYEFVETDEKMQIIDAASDQKFVFALESAYWILAFVRMFKDLGTAILKSIYQTMLVGSKIKKYDPTILDFALNANLVPQLERIPSTSIEVISKFCQGEIHGFFRGLYNGTDDESRQKYANDFQIYLDFLDLPNSSKLQERFWNKNIDDKTWDEILSKWNAFKSRTRLPQDVPTFLESLSDLQKTFDFV